MLFSPSDEKYDTALLHTQFVRFASLLRLDDWDITLQVIGLNDERFTEHKEADEDEIFGLCLIDGDAREADILMVDPALYDHPGGWEHTLMHELMHLVVNPILEEQGVAGIERIINHVVKTLEIATGARDRRPRRKLTDEDFPIQRAEATSGELAELPWRDSGGA